MQRLISDRYRLASVGITLVALLVLLVIYASAPDAQREEPVERAMPVDVVDIEFAEHRLPVRARGIVRPARQVALVARVDGRIMEVSEQFRDGGLVEEGELLLQVDDESYQLALARHRHDTAAARLHLAEVEARARVARRTNGENASPFARLEPHEQEARARLQATEAALRRAAMQVEDTRLTAPFAGRLSEVSVQPGQDIHAGQSLASIYGTSVMEVRLPVRDEWLALIDLPLTGRLEGQSLPITLHGSFGGVAGEWPGRIVRREGGLGDNRMIYLVARIDGADQAGVPMEPGMLVEAVIRGRAMAGVARLPRSVLAGDSRVWLIDQQQRLRQREVEVLYQDGNHVWLSGGVEEGQRIALNGGLRWLEGTAVEPRRQALADHAGMFPERGGVFQRVLKRGLN